MSIKKIFEDFADDFELAIDDDDWGRLEKYLADDATYINVGFQEEKIKGSKAILHFFKEDLATDRKYSSRNLSALTEPKVDGDRLMRKWRTVYTLTGAPDLVVEGEARYLFEGKLIKEIEQQLTPESSNTFMKWMEEYGERLNA